MIHHASPISAHRLARHLKWCRAWLAWLVRGLAFFHGADKPLPAHVEPIVRLWVGEIRQRVIIVLITLALARVKPPARRAHGGPPRDRAVSQRVVLGLRLRRALIGRGRFDYIRALWAALADPEKLIAAIAARLARRFTRLRQAPAFARALTLAAPRAEDRRPPAGLCADTS